MRLPLSAIRGIKNYNHKEQKDNRNIRQVGVLPANLYLRSSILKRNRLNKFHASLRNPYNFLEALLSPPPW